MRLPSAIEHKRLRDLRCLLGVSVGNVRLPFRSTILICKSTLDEKYPSVENTEA